jgi:transposase-like protein
MTLERIPFSNLNFTLENNGLAETPVKKHHNGLGVKKRSYTIAFKKKIMDQLALANGSREALNEIATIHNLSPRTLYKWKKNPNLEEGAIKC